MKQLPPFLTHRGDGAIVLTGHRIGLYHIVTYYNEGYSPEMLLEQFPSITLSLIHKTIAFYLDHKNEVDLYCTDVKKTIDKHQTAGRQVDIVQLRERLAQRAKVEVAAGT